MSSSRNNNEPKSDQIKQNGQVFFESIDGNFNEKNDEKSASNNNESSFNESDSNVSKSCKQSKNSVMKGKDKIRFNLEKNRKLETMYSIPENWGSKIKRLDNSLRMDRDIKTTSIKKRLSSQDSNLNPRRESLKNMIFGNPKFSRRFSEDLRPKSDFGQKDETMKVIFMQVFIPFLIAGFGNVGAGLILDQIQFWDVFQDISELLILVAAFLGFKGNLEMTLAARLSTQANLGNLDKRVDQWKMGFGNVLLIQCQAIVVAFLASLIAISANLFTKSTIQVNHYFLICATSLITASITGFFLASLMIIVVIFARKTGVNPDNCSTLIAAFLGDITAVIVLAFSAKLLYLAKNNVWVSPFLMLSFVFALPLFLIIARKNIYTHDVINQGWWPIIISMIISSVGGLIFNQAVYYFKTIAIFQPIINGVGSNLVAVQASRISTYLHQRCNLGQEPPKSCKVNTSLCQLPHKTFFGSNPNIKTARLLLFMVFPGHLIYIATIKLVKVDDVTLTLSYISSYLLVASLQVAVLLYITHILVPFLWINKIDPDNSAIPALMATGDLIGTSLFTIAYFMLARFGDPNAKSPNFDQA